MDITSRAQAIDKIDDLIALRWGLILNGKCSICESILDMDPIRPEDDSVIHRVDCTVTEKLKMINSLSDKWSIPMGHAVVMKDVNGLKMACVGPSRITQIDYTD